MRKENTSDMTESFLFNSSSERLNGSCWDSHVSDWSWQVGLATMIIEHYAAATVGETSMLENGPRRAREGMSFEYRLQLGNTSVRL